VMSYGGGSTVNVPRALPGSTTKKSPKHDCGCDGPDPHVCHCHDKQHKSTAEDLPDFARMTPAEKLAYNKAKRDRIFG